MSKIELHRCQTTRFREVLDSFEVTNPKYKNAGLDFTKLANLLTNVTKGIFISPSPIPFKVIPHYQDLNKF